MLDQLDEPADQFGRAALVQQSPPQHLQSRTPARRKAGANRYIQRQLPIDYELVIPAKHGIEVARAYDADLQGNDHDTEHSPGPDPDLVDEPAPSARLRRQLYQHTHLSERPLEIAPNDAETLGTRPFEWLLFPFYGCAQARKAQAAKRILRGLFARGAACDRRHASVMIEAVGIGDERP